MASAKTLELRARETALKTRAKGYYVVAPAKGDDQPEQRVLKVHVDAKWREQLEKARAASTDAQITEALRRANDAERNHVAVAGAVE